MPKEPSVAEMVALARAAAAEAANYQERFAAEDTEARKIVDILEHFLRIKGRVVYGGAAINAHMPPEKKFYDPRLYLPDYDFMTPDPLQDCADLIVAFQAEGFTDVEAKFGIHEGTYKIFVNFRSAADITYMPPEIYERVISDAVTIEGIRYASPNYLRMNMYLELSRPAGMVSRWEKVYQRLLLLNEEHPIKAGHCTDEPLKALGRGSSTATAATQDRIVEIGVDAGAVFLSGASWLAGTPPSADEIVLMITPHRKDLSRRIADTIKTPLLHLAEFPSSGELLPARTELHSLSPDGPLIAVIFDTVACHSYTTLATPPGYRLGSIDLLIQMYYAFHFAELNNLLSVRLMCVIQELVDLESTRRAAAAATGEPAHDVFPLECVGHQPTMPELKKAHRERVREKRKELVKVLRLQESSTARPRAQTRRRRRQPPPDPR
jgi:hypothetical protein